ncbi:hypothetical protein [Acinetobacter bereziniae]|uniref:hypothetical protein n=1 Tax=Acinetobacter bereziniae TaxID=106648 RepID=UPI0029536CCD|nr:hypothetical protein [Acinetobacter bereziniae]MDV8158089.1 hypothetical protein [Acinetobacter bereziniae]
MFTATSVKARDNKLISLNYFDKPIITSSEDGKSHELDKYYTFDEKGHIMVVTTSKNVDSPDPDVVATFKKCLVFFGAWTAALAQKNKTLFDYQAVTEVITNSGFFINTTKEKRNYYSKSTTVSLNTDIIKNVLGGAVSGGGMAIASRVLANLGDTIKASSETETSNKEICHLLFICESLMGIPIVTVSLYHTKLAQNSWVSKTNCSEVSRSEIKFDYEADDYLFVDPKVIEECSEEFEQSSAYKELIDKLAASITD